MNEEENIDPEVKKKGERAQMILYGTMLFFLVLPFLVLWLLRR